MSLPRYPNYKDSGVEWLGEVPEHWEVRKARWLCEIKKRISGELGHDVLSITQQGIRVRDLESNDGQLSMDYSKYQFVEVGDFAMNHMDLLTGYVDIASARGVTSPDYRVFSIRDPDVCFDQYLLYLFQMGYKNRIFYAYGQGSSQLGRWRLPTEQFQELAFPLPPATEQAQIAIFLDRETAKIDELVAEQRRLMALLKEKRQAVISHAVTRGLNPDAPLKPSGIEWLGDVPEHWPIGKCGFYLSILSGYAFPSTEFSTNESDTRLLRGINVGVSRLKWDEVVYWNRSTDDGLKEYEMKAGDLVIGMDRPQISDGMRVAKVQNTDLPCLLLQRVASLTTGQLLNSDFLLHLLSSEIFVAHFSPDTTGVSVPHISPDQIRNFVIPIPPMAEQLVILESIATGLAKIDTLTTEAQRAIDLLQERRTALISAAVTGQIDVQGVVSA